MRIGIVVENSIFIVTVKRIPSVVIDCHIEDVFKHPAGIDVIGNKEDIASAEKGGRNRHDVKLDR